MRRRRMGIVAMVLCAAGLLAAAPAEAGDVNFVWGNRTFDDDWSPVEDQGVLGVTADFGGRDWPINIAVGYHFSLDTSIGVSGSTVDDVDLLVKELSVGVMKVWRTAPHTRPYLGAGLSLLNVDAETGPLGTASNEEDESPGFYAEGGAFWTLGRRFNLGAGLRTVQATSVDFRGGQDDVNYIQYGVVIGWAFGSGVRTPAAGAASEN